jgi:8-oxo-dGTP diphosphatase
MMTIERRREFTCAILLDTFGRFLLQQRDNVPGVVHPAKIGLFGGQREAGETHLQCIVREVHEELSYFLPPERFEYVASYDATTSTLRATRSFTASFSLRMECQSKES